MADTIRLVVKGGIGVGKSAITIRFVQNHFVEDYDPTIYDCYRKLIHIDAESIMLDILDTVRFEEYCDPGPNHIKQGHGFLCVYSITSRDSFNEVSSFMKEILMVHDNDKVPMILVGNKSDLTLTERVVAIAEGRELAQSFGCSFLETSAKTTENIEESFNQLVCEIKKMRLKSDPNEQVSNITKKDQITCSLF
eukprot:TRINITY_DN2335_c0_g2_i1.p1 TRINITY_DN2335_c0_g2~~TRINITY_DN2335_c0_g2_i1.p1  ORF type:complete len:212 (-),score=22.49 TRINITY_DN2335_c0_g2_i1:75-656(-)